MRRRQQPPPPPLSTMCAASHTQTHSYPDEWDRILWIIVWNKMPTKWLRLRWQQMATSENVHRFVNACGVCVCVWPVRYTTTTTTTITATTTALYSGWAESWRVAGSKCDDWREMGKFIWYYFSCRTMKMRLDPHACDTEHDHFISVLRFNVHREQRVREKKNLFFILFHFIAGP